MGLVFLRGSEDDWIVDPRGVYIKHGNPTGTPNHVIEQQAIINCANDLYNQNKNNNTEFYSQCLGRCQGYSVDIVHVPRNSEDDLEENQCSDFREGLTKHFIELDLNGEIARIV